MERHLKAEVQELFALAEQADQPGIPEGVNLPEEIQRREDRLAVMAAAKARIAERAQARYAKEKGHYDTNMARRAEREVLGCQTAPEIYQFLAENSVKMVYP